MTAEDNGLTLEGLARRLGALERENERVHSENDALRSKVSNLEGSGAAQTDNGEPASEWSAADGQVSRTWLLTKAGAAALGAVAAGTLLNASAATAHDLDPGISPSQIVTHFILADNHIDPNAAALEATATTDSAEVGAVDSENLGSGSGVRGIANAMSGIGVEGIAKGSNGTGVQ
jgi:hypothetical protein